MYKLLLGAALLLVLRTHAQDRLLNQPMDIKKVSISVKADCFTAVTFIEMEFYNPKDVEIEGLFHFTLQPGQVITAFQLDLNGQFRDGSIEEKWKATNAYNTIVGKRVDPALVTWLHGTTYQLNIYPVPAKSSRRITMTLHQILQPYKERLLYHFDWGRNNQKTAEFNLDIRTADCGIPLADTGFLAGNTFSQQEMGFGLSRKEKDFAISTPIRFTLPLTNAYCTRNREGKTTFALRLLHEIPEQVLLQPKKLRVYWDVSASTSNRNTQRELTFLKDFIQKHGIEELTFIPFNEQVDAQKKFYPKESRNWVRHIESMRYDGATRFDELAFEKNSDELVFLFSDGIRSIGSKNIEASPVPLFAFASGKHHDSTFLKALVGTSGGVYTDLTKTTIYAAVQKASFARNQIIDMQTSKGHAVVNVGELNNKSLFVYGTLTGNDTLWITYGKGTSVVNRTGIPLNIHSGCASAGVDRISMLMNYPAPNGYWTNALEFGLQEKVVTPNTAYIVLERVEDYVRYNISPPAELEEACLKLGWVKRDPLVLKKQLKERDDFEILQGVVTYYNYLMRQWDGQASLINFERKEWDKKTAVVSNLSSNKEQPLPESLGDMVSLDEVVVTGYSSGNASSSMTESMSKTRAKDIHAGIPVNQLLQGRAPGLVINGNPGSASSFMLRGQASLGNAQPLYVLDGFPIDGNIDDYITSQQIHNITVLRGPQATALYGGRAMAGAIIVNTIRTMYSYNNYQNYPRRYKLKHQPDEDYMTPIKAESNWNKTRAYEEERKAHQDDPLFFIDVAQHFYESGLHKQAYSTLLNATEVAEGSQEVLRTIGYVLESWKKFEDAEHIYEQLIQAYPTDLRLHRDLAWAHYQQGNIREAAQILYDATRMNLEQVEGYHRIEKTSLLNDLNGIIALHKDSINFDFIPSMLIKPMPVDLRIVVTGSTVTRSMRICEPSTRNCTRQTKTGKMKGWLLPDQYSGIVHYTNEYNNRHADKGKYRVSVTVYNQNTRLPEVVRMISFKNFAQKGQKLKIEHVILNNQWGEVEIGELTVDR